MKMKKMMKWAAVCAAALLLFACETDGGDEEETGGVDFTSHNTDYSILVRNNTSYRLVSFKGDLQASKLIGGIPAHATGSGHGLPFSPALFDKTEDFPLILLTESQYNANKDNLASQKNSPFTRVYVFYNKTGDNSAVYEIAEGLGGNNSLRIINPSTSLNVEIRLGGVAGETVGYAPAGMQETTLKLVDGNYILFPVFKRYNAFRDVVETVYPKRADGQPERASTSFGDFGPPVGEVREFTINMSDLMKGLPMTSGTAWVVIDNQTNQGVRFMEGAAVRKTLSNLENVPSGYSLTWQIDMNRVSDNNYADSRVISGWKFGPIGDEVALQKGENDPTKLESVTIERDKMYTITVSGVAGTNLKAWISDESAIDVSDFDL
jgi:hypothetical protein